MLNIVSIITSGSFFLLAFIVAVNPRQVNIMAHRWLALLLFTIAVILLDDHLFINGVYTEYPILIGWVNIPVFSLAPLLYLTVTYFVTPTNRFDWRNLWHFSLVFLFFPLTVAYTFLPNEEKLNDIKTPITQSDIIRGLLLIIAPLVIYWWLSYRKLLKHQKNIQLFASSTETVDLAWLRYFLWGLGFMVLAWLGEIVSWKPAISYITTPIYFLSAYYLAYFVLRQGEVFDAQPQEVQVLQQLIEENEQKNIPKKQLLAETELNTLKQQLHSLMEKDKPYLDSTLSLSKLAEKMNLNSHELSYLINTGFSDNFFGFINTYRVEESKRLLLSEKHQHLSVLGIAFEAGFNSKTAFNTTFKKMVGVSPSEFRTR